MKTTQKAKSKPAAKRVQNRAVLDGAARPSLPDFTKRRPGSMSRSILAWLVLSAISFQLPAFATITVTGLVSQITSEALETKITFTPAADILLLTNGLSAGPAKTISSAANGGFTNTFNPGTYLVRLPLISGRNAFTIAVPHGNGIENITNLIAAPWTYEQFVNTVGGGTVQTNISWTAVTNLPSFGALTNSDTRDITFIGSVVGANVFSAGTTNLYSANAKNNYSIGTNLTILSAGSHNNVMLGGNSGEIENSIYSAIIGSNPGGSQIRRASTSVMISANDGNMTDTTGCVILGGEHPWIFGGVGTLAGHYNAIIGGNTATIGNEFDDSQHVRANAIVAGRENAITGSVVGNVIVGGNNNIVNNATNSLVVGSENNLSGLGVIGLGSLLTNTQNHEVMLGKYGTELRVKTNGVTSMTYISHQGGSASGNVTNTSSWQFGSAGTATETLYTNSTRRGLLYWSGESGEFGAMVRLSLITYNQNNSNTNIWGNQTIWDSGDIAGGLSINAVPINPSQVYYIKTYGTSLSTTFFKIAYE